MYSIRRSPRVSDAASRQLPAKHSRTLDLEELESDPAPIFVVRAGPEALHFDFVYVNETFRRDGFRDVVLEQGKAALLFRTWAQAVGACNERQYDFAGRSWTAETAGRNIAFKVLRATEIVPQVSLSQDKHATPRASTETSVKTTTSRTLVYMRSKEELLCEYRRTRALLPSAMHRSTLDARWEGLQTMMEMRRVNTSWQRPMYR
jgi:hypothetical protein